MNWKTLIQQMLDSGKTQAWIATQCGTGQSHISQLYKGKRKQPNWELGNKLIRLNRKVCSRVSASTVDAEKPPIPCSNKEAG